MALSWLLQAAILFVPESSWAMFGVDARSDLAAVPAFIQYYVDTSTFKNAMFVFWITSPVFFSINTMRWIAHANGIGYAAFLLRRTANLRRQGKSSNLGMVVVMLLAVLAYVWGTALYLKEPAILGIHTPAQSRLTMLLVHWGATGVFYPLVFAMVITELRATFFKSDKS